MNNKIIKKILVILTLIMLLFVIYKLVKTYAVFQSDATATVTQQQANWLIKLNNTDISSGIQQNFVVNQIEISSSSHVMAGKIAPGLAGDFYITLDPTGTNVAIRYDITLDKSNMTNEKFTITSIEEILKSNTLTQTAENTYTGVINLADVQNNQNNKVKVSINWDNDENNYNADTTIGTNLSGKVQIPINVVVSQYLGETITQYTP